jgi:hypothetical protein
VFTREFLAYLKKPFFIDTGPTKVSEKVSDIFYGYLVCFALSVLSIILLVVIDIIVSRYCDGFSVFTQLKSNQKNLKLRFGMYLIPLVVVAGPFMEEIIFRLPLKLKQTGIGLSLAVVVYRLIVPHFFRFDGMINYLGTAVALLVFLMTVFYFPPALLKSMREDYFGRFFYLSAIIFALVHISNFMPLRPSLVLIYPLYTLPQFFMGLSFGYIRMRHGFFSACVLHAMVNLPSALLIDFGS